MLYPQKLSSKKTNILLKVMLAISLVIAGILVLINKLTSPGVHWAALSNAGIIYIWITVIYSLNKNINIAAHVMIQTIAISILTVFIDYRIGFSGWSLELSIPIILIIANITMFILTIVSHRKSNVVLCYVAIGISILNFLITIILCAKDVKEAIIRKFHI